jgi:hypothetical protein
MRIWTLHPRYLDRQGLLALWREGLLAQAVLSGKTRGYLNHPLKTKLSTRSPAVLSAIAKVNAPRPHPLFRIVAGPVQNWEKQLSLWR